MKLTCLLSYSSISTVLFLRSSSEVVQLIRDIWGLQNSNIHCRQTTAWMSSQPVAPMPRGSEYFRRQFTILLTLFPSAESHGEYCTDQIVAVAKELMFEKPVSSMQPHMRIRASVYHEVYQYYELY